MIYPKMVISQFAMSNYQRGTLDDLFCAEMVPEFSRAKKWAWLGCDMLEIICSQDIGFDIPFPYSLLCIHSYNSVYVCLYIYATLPPVQNTVNTNTSKSTKRVGTGGAPYIYNIVYPPVIQRC